MATIDVHTFTNHPGLFLSCSVLADANDIVECLSGSEYLFERVGYKAIWLADEQALDYLTAELPLLEQALAEALGREE